MTFEELQALARKTLEYPHSFQQWSDAIDVLADALIVEGYIAADVLDRGEIRATAAGWAKANASRRTGRTTRMLQEALRVASDGARVAVMAANQRHAEQLRHALAGLTTDPQAIRRVEVCAMGEPRHGRAPFDVILEDHHTTDARLGRR